MARPGHNVSLKGYLLNENLGAPRQVLASQSVETISVHSGTRRKPSGWVQPTPYTIETLFVKYPVGTASAKGEYPGAPIRHINGVIGTPDGGGIFNGANAFNECLTRSNLSGYVNGLNLRDKTKLKTRLALKNSQVNLGIAFAERDKTAKLLGDTAISIAKSYRSLRRGDVRAAMRELGISAKRRAPRGSGVPRKWLELQYGWKPLLSEVHGACAALAGREREDWRVTAKGRVRAYHQWYVFYDTFMGYGCNRTICKAEFSTLGRVDAMPSNEVAISLASVGITNPALIAWELVPFSFVVDWALPVGSWLESLDATLGFSVQSYSESLRYKALWNTAYSKHDTRGTGFVKASFAGEKRVFYLSRRVDSDLPQVRYPSLKDPASLGHMANGLALLTQVFGRSKVSGLRSS